MTEKTTATRVTYSVAEVAAMTGLSEVLVRKRVRNGLIPSTTVGDRRLIPASWVDALNPDICGKCHQQVTREDSVPLRINGEAWGFVCNDCRDAAVEDSERVLRDATYRDQIAALRSAERSAPGFKISPRFYDSFDKFLIDGEVYRVYENGTVTIDTREGTRKIMRPGAANLVMLAFANAPQNEEARA